MCPFKRVSIYSPIGASLLKITFLMVLDLTVLEQMIEANFIYPTKIRSLVTQIVDCMGVLMMKGEIYGPALDWHSTGKQKPNKSRGKSLAKKLPNSMAISWHSISLDTLGFTLLIDKFMT